MNSLRKIYVLRTVDHVRNDRVRERCGSKNSPTERADKGVPYGTSIWRGRAKKDSLRGSTVWQ